MSGWEDPTTGLVQPDGIDYVSDIPAIGREFLRRLAPMLRKPVASVSERNAAYPRLGLSDSVVVPVPSLAELHEWDGRQWVITDIRPKRYKPVWYAGSDLKVMSYGSDADAVGEAYYQRRGHMTRWGVHVKRGSDTDKGDGYYSFYLPIPAKSISQTGSGFVRVAGVEYTGGVIFRDSQRACLVIGPSRVGGGSYSWAKGDELVLSGEYETGGLLP